jgi:hypothetical protein
LLKSSVAKVSSLGVNLTAPQLLMEIDELEWSMGEFVKKVGDFAPTLVLIKMKNGTECGGVAGVPWSMEGEIAADPSMGSFIFSLGTAPARFDVIKSEKALYRASYGFAFGYGCDLCVFANGMGCGSEGQVDYAGPREKGQLVGGTTEARYKPYERWELWRL